MYICVFDGVNNIRKSTNPQSFRIVLKGDQNWEQEEKEEGRRRSEETKDDREFASPRLAYLLTSYE